MTARGAPPLVVLCCAGPLLLAGLFLLLPLLLAPAPLPALLQPIARLPLGQPSAGCVSCHTGIEEIHPGYQLTCVDCHGGDGEVRDKDRAHVQPKGAVTGDERVLPKNHDLAWQRFRNPSNLRVADVVCGDCHDPDVGHVLKSLHATTCGHLGDGYYEHGLSKERTPGYGVFAITDDDGEVPEGALRAVEQVPPPRANAPRDRIESHYQDLPRKACMHCHLWSQGRAVRGRLGMDGDYRGEGCAACHVTYADDGRSKSQDPTIDKQEPGHPERHRFTSKVPTSTCARCHYGDASIGLSFRGMAQLVPGMPAGPDVPGTTDTLLNGTFYLQDPSLTPPDVHHQRGMHCIDCHTKQDVMGDGNLWPQMDHAVEIECTSCHGTIDALSDLHTSKGRRVENLHRDGDAFWLVSKVTGARHEVLQSKHVVDPQHKAYNPRAAAAMTDVHDRLECYSCHAGWNVDFFGFHFDRNEQFTQLDLLSGRRTPGRVTTQEKVFATFNQLRLGVNHEGRIAPYMVGFSTIGSFHDENGAPYLDQALPITANGLSGVTLVPHQTHTTRPEARGCVECHRSGVTWGLGSTNFRLTREFAYAIDTRRLLSVALDRKEPARSAVVAELELPAPPRALGVRMDPVRGKATHAYLGLEDGALAVVDLQNPVLPKLVGSRPELHAPRRIVAQGDWLFVADGPGGVLVFDLQKPDKPKLAGHLPSVEARALQVQWPWLYIADGPGGLVVADVADPLAPRAIAQVDLNAESTLPDDACDVAVLFQYSRTEALDALGLEIGRTPARNLCAVAAGVDGLRLVDVTDPAAPQLLHGPRHERAFRGERQDVRGVAWNTQFDLGTEGGGLQSRERDYLFCYEEYGAAQNRQVRLRAFDLSDPLRPAPAPGRPQRVGLAPGRLHVMRAYNAPFLQHFVLAAGSGGVATLVDASKMPTGLEPLAEIGGAAGVRDLVLEEFAFDRLQDERGRQEKDISHEGCRYLEPAEMLRVLRADVPIDREEEGRYGRLRATDPPKKEPR
ncbi:MAG: hypothetical protein AB7O97_12760 [Planctomycetota bacterium]